MKSIRSPFITIDDQNSAAPLYRQIYEQIRDSILNGEFEPNTPLPATRLLAKQLGVSRMTVVNAYEQLFAEGYLESKTGSGTFVAAHLPEEFLQTTRLASENSEKTGSGEKHENNLAIRDIKFSAFGKNLRENYKKILRHHSASSFLPFQHGIPAIDCFPFEIWARIAQKFHKIPPGEILGYGDAAGFYGLREAIAAHLSSARGVSCSANQVIITNGTQQALDLISRVFLSENDAVWLEEPGYLGARDVFSAAGAEIVPVPVDYEGFNLQSARKSNRNARLAYVTPSHQYPLGITMSLARRLSLLEWARETKSFIVEDDYNSEYRYAGRPLASLQGLDRDERVIYLGNFSKTIFPALRLGCLVVPKDLIGIFSAARALNDLHSPTIEQAILAEFIAEGHFARHIRRMRGIYETRQRILVEQAEKHLKGFLEIAPAESGMHLIGWLPENVKDTDVSKEAAKMNLKVAPVSKYFIDENERGGLILGYTAYNEQQIANGVKTLKTVLERK